MELLNRFEIIRLIPKHLRNKTGVNKLLIKILKLETMLSLMKLVKLEATRNQLSRSQNYMYFVVKFHWQKQLLMVFIILIKPKCFHNFDKTIMTDLTLPTICHSLVLYIG